jgi:hypothetical protein
MKQRLMIIRHGEKAEEPAAQHCVNELGHHDDDGLSVRGWQRAGALAALFGSPALAREREVVVPAVLFACAVTPAHKSKRSVLTLGPLAMQRGLSLHAGYTKGDEAALAAFLGTTTEDALICWEHKMIPALGRALAPGNGEVPAHWPDERYDVVWVFERRLGEGREPWLFHQVPQRLLAGDRRDCIGAQ